MNTHRTTLGILARAALAVAGAGVLLGALSACRGDRSDNTPRQFFPDMDDSPQWRPQSESEFFADGRTMRQPVEGTVAFGRVSFLSEEPWAADFMVQRKDLLKDDEAFYQGRAGTTPDGKPIWIERIPIPVTEALLARGQERFGIYCAACHGYEGDGKGMVGQRWAAPVPSWHDPKYRDPNEPDGKNRDGFVFSTALLGVVGPDGVQKMPGYAHALSERDAWAITAYIRVLQETRLGTPDDIPADQRARLEQIRRAATAVQPGAGGGTR